MSGGKGEGSHLSPFDLGRKAGSDPTLADSPNPFAPGTANHNNFEVGRRFGANEATSVWRHALTPEDMAPDPDEDTD